MFKEAPPLETGKHLDAGKTIYRTTCPWCSAPMEWAISWIAVWRELAEHYGSTHRAEQDALKDEWRAALPSTSGSSRYSGPLGGSRS